MEEIKKENEINLKIEEYVNKVMLELFKGHESDMLVTEKDKETARDVIYNLARLEVFHNANMKKDFPEFEKYREMGCVAKLEVLTQKIARIKDIRGFRTQLGHYKEKGHNLSKANIKFYAKEMAKKLIRHLSLDSYLHDVVDEHKLTVKAAVALRNALDNGVHISDCFSKDAEMYKKIENDAKEEVLGYSAKQLGDTSSRQYFNRERNYEKSYNNALDFIAVRKSSFKY